MSRSGRRKEGGRSSNETASAVRFDKPALHQMRFDTSEASAKFMSLRYLDPAWRGSREDGVSLPPIDQSVSSTPGSGGMVYRAFAHGLMYGDELSVAGGIGLFLAALVICFSSMQLVVGGTNPVVDVYSAMTEAGTFFFIVLLFLALVMLAVAPLIVMAIANDLVGFRGVVMDVDGEVLMKKVEDDGKEIFALKKAWVFKDDSHERDSHARVNFSAQDKTDNGVDLLMRDSLVARRHA